MLLETPDSGKPDRPRKAHFEPFHRIYARLAGTLEARCFLCGARSSRYLCNVCFHDLPWNDHACRHCARPLPELPGTLCGACTRKPPEFDTAQAAFAYAWPISRLIQRFKFHGDLATGRILALSLRDYLDMHQVSPPDLILPVPLHPRRLAERGFNQAAEIARIIAPSLHAKVAFNRLARIRHTPAQSELDRAGRRRNVRDAFACRGSVQGLHIAVVDDVITTGSTAEAIAHSLKRVGAASVTLYALARA